MSSMPESLTCFTIPTVPAVLIVDHCFTIIIKDDLHTLACIGKSYIAD